MTKFKTTSTNIIFKWPREEQNLKEGSIELLRFLSRDTGWAECVEPGPDSVVSKGDKLLLSRRVTTYKLNIDGEEMGNTSDASVLGYEHKGELKATCGTVLYEWLENVEEVTESGIIIVEKETTKEMGTIRKALVHAAGPDSGVKAGDTILLAYNKDAYSIKYNGVELHNAGKEAIIAYWPKEIKTNSKIDQFILERCTAANPCGQEHTVKVKAERPKQSQTK